MASSTFSEDRGAALARMRPLAPAPEDDAEHGDRRDRQGGGRREQIERGLAVPPFRVGLDERRGEEHGESEAGDSREIFRTGTQAALMAAALLGEGPTTLRNVPDLADVTTLLELLRRAIMGEKG